MQQLPLQDRLREAGRLLSVRFHGPPLPAESNTLLAPSSEGFMTETGPQDIVREKEEFGMTLGF